MSKPIIPVSRVSSAAFHVMNTVELQLPANVAAPKHTSRRPRSPRHGVLRASLKAIPGRTSNLNPMSGNDFEGFGRPNWQKPENGDEHAQESGGESQEALAGDAPQSEQPQAPEHPEVKEHPGVAGEPSGHEGFGAHFGRPSEPQADDSTPSAGGYEAPAAPTWPSATEQAAPADAESATPEPVIDQGPRQTRTAPRSSDSARETRPQSWVAATATRPRSSTAQLRQRRAGSKPLHRSRPPGTVRHPPPLPHRAGSSSRLPPRGASPRKKVKTHRPRRPLPGTHRTPATQLPGRTEAALQRLPTVR